jgi:nucleotide-binding universal stress UspA family protein
MPFAGRSSAGDGVPEGVKAAALAGARSADGRTPTAEAPDVVMATLPDHGDPVDAVLREAAKGHDIIFIGGRRRPPGGGAVTFDADVARLVRDFEGVTALAVSRGAALVRPRRILVPTTGTDYSKRAGEIAVAIAKAVGATLTALHVRRPGRRAHPALATDRREEDRARAPVDELVALARRDGVIADAAVVADDPEEAAIMSEAARGSYDLLVLGVKLRPGEHLFFGDTAHAIIDSRCCTLLLVES